MVILRYIAKAYIERMALYGSFVGGIALFMGLLSDIQRFIEHNRSIAVIALIIDMIIFAIGKLASLEEDHQRLQLQIRVAEKRKRSNNVDDAN